MVGLTNEERIDWAMNGSVDCTEKFLKSSLKPKIFGIIYNCIFRKLSKHMGIKLKKQIRNITVYLYWDPAYSGYRGLIYQVELDKQMKKNWLGSEKKCRFSGKSPEKYTETRNTEKSEPLL